MLDTLPFSTYLRYDDARVIECRGNALVLLANVYFEVQQVSVRREDKLILFTDGLQEDSLGKNPWPSQLPRLLDIVPNLRGMALQEIPENLKNLLVSQETHASDTS